MLKFFQDVSHNLARKSSGKRYSDAVKDLYTWLRIKGGPRIVKMLAMNFDGPGGFKLHNCSVIVNG